LRWLRIASTYVVKNSSIYESGRHVEVEELAREIEVLSEYEKMES